MAFRVTPTRRLEGEITKALQTHFGDKAEITRGPDDLLHINITGGYPQEIKSLTKEQIDAGVYGGGIKMALDGGKFIIKVEEEK